MAVGLYGSVGRFVQLVDQRIGCIFVGRKGDERPIIPLFHRLSGPRHQPGTQHLSAVGGRPNVDGPPAHAPSASFSLDQKPGARLGPSPSSLASSRNNRSCSSVSRSGVQTCTRTSRSPLLSCPRIGKPFPRRRSTVSG